jgi:nucleotide-binding universal stress UspA family protein
MKHLLVAVDMGPSSEAAFGRAVQLATARGADQTLVHVVDDQLLAYGDREGLFEADVVRRAEESLSRYAERLPRTLARSFRQVVAVGRPFEKILKVARTRRADVIILGLHRAGSIRDIFVGTTAERVIRLGTHPVLVVKNPVQGPYRSVLLGTDFSPASSHALSAALDLAPAARLKVAHIFETPFTAFVRVSEEDMSDLREELSATARRQTERDLRRFMKSHPGSKKPAVQIIVQSVQAAGGMAAVVKSEKPDLLVLGSNGRSRMLGAMLGSTTGSFLHDPPCDVLVSR